MSKGTKQGADELGVRHLLMRVATCGCGVALCYYFVSLDDLDWTARLALVGSVGVTACCAFLVVDWFLRRRKKVMRVCATCEYRHHPTCMLERVAVSGHHDFVDAEDLQRQYGCGSWKEPAWLRRGD